MAFLDESPSPFHAVTAMQHTLQEHGFNNLDPEAPWSIGSRDKALVLRNGSSLIAFRTGSAPLSESGVRMIGAHTDSPNLRLKPQAGYAKNGYLQLGVEVYGGVLLSTWLDRDLSLAGRVIL